MPSKWLTWTPETANSTEVEVTKVTKTAEATAEGVLSPVTSLGHPQRLGGAQIFPHCPRCLSYFLYRQKNGGDFECQTCGLTEISEEAARRVQ
jgi:hypothetical protein